jgi:nicotinate-nucleotide--dimethylbenzimidazole phosphoribosyltransferase
MFVSPEITPLQTQSEFSQKLKHKLNCQTKPPGSLGRLESLALQIGLIQGHESPELTSPQMLVFAADHGLAAQGVSAYPAEVTAQMVENFLNGGAAISVLARQHGLALTVIDAGVKCDFDHRPGLEICKIAHGTQDTSKRPAMSQVQCQQALQAGCDVVQKRSGNAVLLGEMGIGNTASAALLMAALTPIALADCVGRGTGLDASGLARKQAILQKVWLLHTRPKAAQTDLNPVQALATFGGFEMAMMVGAALQAAHERRLIVVDGFIVSAALLVAAKLNPAVLNYCVFAHCSGEQGHRALLAHLGVTPLLDWGLRLGEGSGAALVWPLILSAIHLLNDMASFESAGVSDRLDSSTKTTGLMQKVPG